MSATYAISAGVSCLFLGTLLWNPKGSLPATEVETLLVSLDIGSDLETVDSSVSGPFDPGDVCAVGTLVSAKCETKRSLSVSIRPRAS